MQRRSALLGLAIGLALADSSVVTLALPDILRDYDVSITTVAWVLTSYNLVLALLAVPAAFVARRRPVPAFFTGIGIFAIASLFCGLAPSFDALIAGRTLQALGGALVITAALDLLSEIEDGVAPALHIWVVAGVVGAAVGPAVGGLLTQTLGWQSIFLAQVPLALITILGVRNVAAHRLPHPAGRPAIGPNLALLLLSGGLVAALFLVVLLLVDGWSMSPALAGLVVSVMPIAAITTSRLAHLAGTTKLRAATGVVLVTGGLGALALLPGASWQWTIAPQILVGAGLGLAIPALTEWALRDAPDQVVHGGWAIASRHAGVVLGLALLAPLLAHTLDHNRTLALNAGTASVLDSTIPPLQKLGVAQDVLAEVDRASGSLPDVAAAFNDRPDTPEYRSLLTTLEDQLNRAVTSAFSLPFALAALLAALALAPVAIHRSRAP